MLPPTIILAYTRSSCINKHHSYDCRYLQAQVDASIMMIDGLILWMTRGLISTSQNAGLGGTPQPAEDAMYSSSFQNLSEATPPT
ncbi:predicted protein [Lichtheimia corymbifera JMRC:FSU:9682]|uniref:Uncharacterized protein n=1 Tax=Lichtheimia corymbifera JMRC:FSU:9682 TaxID=1263082 RepID=A0A068RPB1_9FUNG|nr:predicted protein [Lichtheimia corymbifera JMRC:FSU:9682]